LKESIFYFRRLQTNIINHSLKINIFQNICIVNKAIYTRLCRLYLFIFISFSKEAFKELFENWKNAANKTE